MVANQIYQFAFAFTTPPTLATSFQQSGSSFQNYQEPNYSHGSVRTGGPNNNNNPNGPSGNYLVVSVGDNLLINIQGPPPVGGQCSWQLPAGTAVQIIISQANSPGNSQGFSPFPGGAVYYNVPTASWQLLSDNQTLQYQLPSAIPSAANPGQGNFNRFEVTVAFAASPVGSTTQSWFSDDPEMDVQGT
jgi:hypothetical protein